jgi:hypothetical protein
VSDHDLEVAWREWFTAYKNGETQSVNMFEAFKAGVKFGGRAACKEYRSRIEQAMDTAERLAPPM